MTLPSDVMEQSLVEDNAPCNLMESSAVMLLDNRG